jgi:transposase
VGVSERLSVAAAKFRVIVTRRSKYAQRGRDSVIQAPAPPHIIESGIPTEALLAQIAVAKYADGLPLYRPGDARIRDDGAMEKHQCKPSLTRCPWRGRNCCRPRSAGHKSSSDTRHDEEPVVRSCAYFYTTIVFDKFGQHLPLNRQSQRFKCEGIDLSVSTVADQVAAAAFAVMPLSA